MLKHNDNTRLRPATPEDAGVLTTLINHAGEGLPVYLWARMAGPGESPWAVGRARAVRETGGFSYRNATIAETGGRAAGALIGYGIGSQPDPVSGDTPPMFVPLQELENIALCTWYVNVLAVLPEFRNLGLGSTLLDRAEARGRALGKQGMSIIVSSANPGARRLYERHGYVEKASRAIVKEGWVNEGRDWVLLTKPL
jgi:ribosomal protein S18 acetylase RimI-like enzyme